MCSVMRFLGLFAALFFGLLASALAGDAEEGFMRMFDGKSLDGWRGKSQFWSVRDGAITGETTKENPTDGNTFLIYQDHVADFELRLKFKIVSGNSGIQYRSINMGGAVVQGYQADIDPADELLGDLYEERGRGLLAKGCDKVEISEGGTRVVVGKTCDRSELAKAVRWRDWNDYRVIARGERLLQEINGIVTVDVIDKERNKARAEGVLALQLHAGTPMLVQFKDIRLKALNER
jgi:3-keto-disaccharide hydrolase